MSQKEAINVVSWVFGGFATVIVSARLFTRTVLTHYFGWDDAFIILSLVRTRRTDSIPVSHSVSLTQTKGKCPCVLLLGSNRH